MKQYLIRSILFIITLMILFLLEGRTKNIDNTFQEAIESFNRYEKVVNEFIESPTEEKMENITQYSQQFSIDYYNLINHQTLYNKLLRIKPILTKEEILSLEELHSKYQKLDINYVSTALTKVYKAYDFSIFIDEAFEKGEYKSEGIEIQYLEDNYINIEINGTFYLEDSTNILSRYFIIETEQDNYYWKKPHNFSMYYTQSDVFIKVDNTKYDIKGSIVYRDN